MDCCHVRDTMGQSIPVKQYFDKSVNAWYCALLQPLDVYKDTDNTRECENHESGGEIKPRAHSYRPYTVVACKM